MDLCPRTARYRFLLIAFVVLVMLGSSVKRVHGERPNRICIPPECTESRNVRDVETLEAIEVVVRVPKPEAQIFTPKMKTKYETIMYEKSFLKDILDSVREGPF